MLCARVQVGGVRMLPVRWMSPEAVKYGRYTTVTHGFTAWCCGRYLHTASKYSCKRCHTEGKDIAYTMCYVIMHEEEAHIDAGYASQHSEPQHQHAGKVCPLTAYNIGLVSKFPLEYIYALVIPRIDKAISKTF